MTGQFASYAYAISGRPSLPGWLLLIADWLTLGREERGGSLRVGGGGRLLERSSLGWKLPTAYTPCIRAHMSMQQKDTLQWLCLSLHYAQRIDLGKQVCVFS